MKTIQDMKLIFAQMLWKAQGTLSVNFKPFWWIFVGTIEFKRCFFHDFWPFFSLLKYYWCFSKDTRVSRIFFFQAWRYKWLTAKKKSKLIALIWYEWKIIKDKRMCHFSLNFAKGINSKKCFKTFWSQSATHQNSLHNSFLAYLTKFVCFHLLKDCRFGGKNFQCSSVGRFFCIYFKNQKSV